MERPTRKRSLRSNWYRELQSKPARKPDEIRWLPTLTMFALTKVSSRNSSMNVNLTPALEKLVRAKAKAGRYDSASEVVREALRIMEEREARRSTPVSTPCGVEKVWMARRSSVLWSGKGQRVSEAPRPGRERSFPSFREGEPRFTDPRAEGRSTASPNP